ncbi:hypothetical protein ACEZCY_25900 [Streptacidiphilus sp. N1-12]|uniref:Uncharacterized protein n=2 Tax=Streptacidiphilus alkalitolerans TaxID=3342712 RepID=A0ABV6V7H7_9ACTN
MTALHLADPRESADLGAFLVRLLRYDKAAAVRLQTANGALAVFARLPLGESGPLVIRTVALLPQEADGLDLTVSAGLLLDGIDETEAASKAGVEAPAPVPTVTVPGARQGTSLGTDATTTTTTAAGTLTLPAPITGPAWAGLLPPRTSWEFVADLATGRLNAAVQAAVTEFRQESTDPDGLAEAIWSRQVHPSGLTMRALHAAHLVGLLRQSETVALHRHPAWLRLTAPRGSVIIRRAPAIGSGLGLTPTR